MLVYLIRHGQSFSNASGVRNGQTDVPLTNQGYLDAQRAGEKLRGIHFDFVISSDLISKKVFFGRYRCCISS